MMITVLCVDGNLFLNNHPILNDTATRAFKIASDLVHALESTVGEDNVEFQFN